MQLKDPLVVSIRIMIGGYGDCGDQQRVECVRGCLPVGKLEMMVTSTTRQPCFDIYICARTDQVLYVDPLESQRIKELLFWSGFVIKEMFVPTYVYNEGCNGTYYSMNESGTLEEVFRLPVREEGYPDARFTVKEWKSLGKLIAGIEMRGVY